MIVICPKCGEKTDLDNKACSHCGCEIKQCPECGCVLNADIPKCNYCGVDVPSAQKIEQETIENERLKELHNKAEQYYAACAKLKKRFSLLIIGLFCIGVLFLFLALEKGLDFGYSTSRTWEDGTNLLASGASVKSQTKTLLVLSLISFILWNFFNTYFVFFIRFILSRKIDEDKFDYPAYCKSISLPKERSEGSDDKTKHAFPMTVEAKFFLVTCKEKIDPSAKIREMVKYSISFILWLFIIISLYVGVQSNANAYILNALLTGNAEMSFHFHPSFIVAIVLFVLDMFVPFFDRTFLDRIIPQENLEDWLTKYQSK